MSKGIHNKAHILAFLFNSAPGSVVKSEFDSLHFFTTFISYTVPSSADCLSGHINWSLVQTANNSQLDCPSLQHL